MSQLVQFHLQYLNMKTIKFGNTEIRIDDFKIKSKREFKSIYSNKVHKFDLDEAWEELKKYVKKPSKKYQSD